MVLSPQRFFRAVWRDLKQYYVQPNLIALIFRKTKSGADFKNWSDVGSILVVKLDEIGDFVLATAFLRELRRNCRGGKIVLVVAAQVYNLAETCPYVDKVYKFNHKVEGHFGVLRRRFRALMFAYRNLWAERFEVAVVPRFDADTYGATEIAAFSNANTVIGYSEKCTILKSTANPGYDALLSHTIKPGEHRGTEMRANLYILEKFQAVVNSCESELWLTKEDETFAASRLNRVGKYIAVATGASKPDRCWPIEKYQELVRWCSEEYGLTPVLIGLVSDPKLSGALSLLGETTLRQAAAVLKRCVLFVGNDSGPKHIAAAMRTPVVEISALRLGKDPLHPNSPDRFQACSAAQVVVRPPQGGPGDLAIDEITVEQVQAAVRSLLASTVLWKK
ncbi:MAG: glycosyltransferase family 9 protein [Nibricoccus sp.]